MAFFVTSKIPLKISSAYVYFERQSCCLPYFSLYVSKLVCFYNDVLVDGVSLKCNIQYYNFTGSTATYRDTRMATELIIVIHVLPKHTLLLAACNTNKRLVLAPRSYFGVFEPRYLLAYYFEIVT